MKQSATLDTSFWIHAHRAGLLSYVLDDYDLQCATAVAGELHEFFVAGRDFWQLVRSGRIEVVRPRLDVVKAFGLGERSAMNLALEHTDQILLIDDRRPLQAADALGIRALCTPVLVVKLYHEGRLRLPEALDALSELALPGTISPQLLSAAAELLNSIAEGGAQRSAYKEAIDLGPSGRNVQGPD